MSASSIRKRERKERAYRKITAGRKKKRINKVRHVQDHNLGSKQMLHHLLLKSCSNMLEKPKSSCHTLSILHQIWFTSCRDFSEQGESNMFLLFQSVLLCHTGKCHTTSMLRYISGMHLYTLMKLDENLQDHALNVPKMLCSCITLWWGVTNKNIFLFLSFKVFVLYLSSFFSLNTCQHLNFKCTSSQISWIYQKEILVQVMSSQHQIWHTSFSDHPGQKVLIESATFCPNIEEIRFLICSEHSEYNCRCVV